MSRRDFLGLAAASATALAADAFLVEPNRLRITRHTLGTPHSESVPLRLAQLTDLHLGSVGRHEERIAAAVHELGPDLIAITGDAIDRADRLGGLRDFLKLLPQAPQKVATLGNWEHWSGVDLSTLRKVYESSSVELLLNQSAMVESAGASALITWLDDSTGGRPDLDAALEGFASNSNHLLLAHSPAFRDSLVRASSLREDSGDATPGPTLILSGHTHGGQVAPFGWAPFTPAGSGRYVRGWYRDRHPHLYVSAGLGTSVLPIRLGVLPEIATFDWHLRGEFVS